MLLDGREPGSILFDLVHLGLQDIIGNLDDPVLGLVFEQEEAGVVLELVGQGHVAGGSFVFYLLQPGGIGFDQLDRFVHEFEGNLVHGHAGREVGGHNGCVADGSGSGRCFFFTRTGGEEQGGGKPDTCKINRTHFHRFLCFGLVVNTNGRGKNSGFL